MRYQLNVRQLNQVCLFELTCGQQRISVQLDLPQRLLEEYQAWQRAYLGYYKQALRGRTGVTGQVTNLEIDWQSRLVQCESQLLVDFHQWLRHADLYDVRQTISRASRQYAAQARGNDRLNLFLSCTPLAIARLPWETWEFEGPVQIVRSPVNIQVNTSDRRPFRHGKTRVLAILGDETGLNFTGERTALNAHPQLDVHYVGWKPHTDISTLRTEICQAISDPQGWDILFFAGHSNEQATVAGQIAIAPHQHLSIRELSPYLVKAQQRGLQFALFNSCSGLDIANALINLGLSQVAIMREPIHNQVAHVFLEQFLQRLASYEDVESALTGACQFLKTQKDLTYPSTYLVPSLFRHPYSVPYRLQPTGWRHRLHQLKPKRREAIAVTAIALLSLWSPVTDWLLDQRVYVQAVYRDLTGQIAEAATPPIVLAQVDQRTFAEFGLERIEVTDRALLADVITQLSNLGARVIGIDYIFDLAQPENDAQLKAAFQQAIRDHQAWLVLATTKNYKGEWFETTKALQSPWLIYGDAWVPMWHLRPWQTAVDEKLPLSAQLAIAHHIQQDALVTQAGSLSPEFLQARQSAQAAAIEAGALPARAELKPLTQFSYDWQQRWLQPLIDFSIPPDNTYTVIPVWQLLQAPAATLQEQQLSALTDAVVIVAPSDQTFDGTGEDSFPLPPAVAYWFQQTGNPSSRLSGGEAHAYMTHHLLSDRLVVPIPDLWLVLLAALVGQTLAIYLSERPPSRRSTVASGLVAATIGYGLCGLQLYISGALLLPWLLPTLTIWIYVLPTLRENYHEAK